MSNLPPSPDGQEPYLSIQVFLSVYTKSPDHKTFPRIKQEKSDSKPLGPTGMEEGL
jgi:hypothetical protein